MSKDEFEKELNEAAEQELQQQGETIEQYRERMAKIEDEAQEAQQEGRKTGTIWDFYGGSPTGQKKGESYEHVAHGAPAKHEHGVLYEGRWEIEAHGICEHVRRNALALNQAGVPVHLQSSRMGYNPTVKGEDRHLREQLTALMQSSFSKRAVQIHHLEPVEGALTLIVTHQWLPKETLALVNQRRIVFAVWERNGLCDEDVEALKRVGMVWTACDRNKEMLLNYGIERVEVIGVPHWPDDPLLKLRSKPRRRGPPRFYHIGKWEPRKNAHGIIGAFLSEFSPGEAHLWLKTTVFGPNVEGYPSSYNHSTTEWYETDRVKANGWTEELILRHIFIIEEDMPRSQMVNLHDTGDIYVSLSHGEGWDLPAYDAKLAGNLMVYTPSGGPQMFAGAEDFRVPPKMKEVSCHPLYRWPGTWIDHELDAAAGTMRMAWEAWKDGRRGEDELREYSAEQVGKRMRNLVEELIGDAPKW
jgi:hypothetical protein